MRNKYFIKIFLILSIFICFNYNVMAEPIDDNEEEVIETKSNDATLKDVVINSEKVVCSNYVCEYIIKNNSVENVTITYSTNHEKAIVSKEKLEEAITFGLNEFIVTVTAEDETKKDYTFKINKKELSTDSSLKSLTINGEKVDLKKGTLKYNTTVSNASKKLDIEAIASNEMATLTLKDSKELKFNNNKLSLDFFDDSKTFSIVVKSEAGDLSTYTISVSKRDKVDTTLKSLKIKNVKLKFESGIFDYEIDILKSVEKLEIEAIPTDSNSKVDIKEPNKLELGENTVTIIVTNDGDSSTYTIKVNKLDQEDKTLANLKSLQIEGYDIEFDENTYEYDLTIGDVNYLNIKAVPQIEDLEVEITGNVDLVDGSIIKIKVIYDEETSAVYKISIDKNEEIKKEDNTSKIVIIIAITLIIVAIIILIVFQIKSKKKNNKKDNKKDNNKKDDNSKLESKQEVEEVKKTNIVTLDVEDIEDII